MSLSMMMIGEVKTIMEFKGKDNMKRRLQELGFIKGEKVQVVGENKSGLVLIIKGAKVALNRGLASMIIVK